MVDIFHYPFPLYRLFFCPANRVWGQGLYFTGDFRKIRSRSRKPIKRKDAWTKEEEDVLRRYYLTEGGKVYLRLNGRTRAACRVRAEKLGLRTVITWGSRKRRKENKMDYTLKPCPFCGGIPVVQETANSWCNVICDKCGAMTACFLNNSEYSSKERAVEAWNRRVVE